MCNTALPLQCVFAKLMLLYVLYPSSDPLLMKYLSVLALLAFLFTATQCKTNKTATNQLTSNSGTATMLEKTWLHSYEDDEDGLKAYRPNTYSFPPSRGRTGFAFKPGGKFLQYDIAPTDGLEEVPGTWKMTDDKTIQISFPAGSKGQPYTMEIVSVSNDLLKVRRK